MVPDLREKRVERDEDRTSNMAASLREFRIANNSETDPFQSCNQALAAIEMTDTRVSKMFAKNPQKLPNTPGDGRNRLS
jgi:hypothetical protein